MSDSTVAIVPMFPFHFIPDRMLLIRSTVVFKLWNRPGNGCGGAGGVVSCDCGFNAAATFCAVTLVLDGGEVGYSIHQGLSGCIKNMFVLGCVYVPVEMALQSCFVHLAVLPGTTSLRDGLQQIVTVLLNCSH